MNNVIDYLESSADRFPDKTAVKDQEKEYTFSELQSKAMCIGTRLSYYECIGGPVAVFSEKSADVLAVFMGIVYAGGFYVTVDPSFPEERINSILSVLKPSVIVCPGENREKLESCSFDGTTVEMEELINSNEADRDLLERIRSKIIDTDPLYGIFTSGSTGVPKCVLVGHRSVIDFIDTFTDTFGVTESDVIGNQAPFDFDVSVKDIYSCLKTGAELVIIPKSYFMFPNNVVDMLEDNKVTTLIWAVSALCLLVRLHALKYKRPSELKRIMFSGEVMPIKQLNQWREYYPDALFVNLYGPTEITCNCLYHILDHEYGDDDKIPAGKPFANERVFILSDEDRLVTERNITGEICVAGTALALGYYNNPEAARRSFVINPINEAYPEIIYRTGDLGYYDDNDLICFAGRKDFQIKHMGHRIELEEIDSALISLDGVEQACTFFDTKKNKMVTFYSGSAENAYIKGRMREKLPDYMIPNVLIKTDTIPLNKNGKLDRAYIKNLYENGGTYEN